MRAAWIPALGFATLLPWACADDTIVGLLAPTGATADGGGGAATDAALPEGGRNPVDAAPDDGPHGGAGGADPGPSSYSFEVGAEEIASTTSGLVRPSIALDTEGRPHVVADRGVIGQQPMQLHIFHRTTAGWNESLFAQSCASSCALPIEVDASRVQLGHLEIDAAGRGWVSAWLGTKEFGSMLGQGVWLVEDIASNPTQRWLGLANDHDNNKNGNLSIDRASPNRAVVMTRSGHWEEFSPAGSSGVEGDLYLGINGEKMRFLIRSRDNGDPGVWHVVGSGWSQEHANYRSSLIDAPVPWASNSAYAMGDDMLHPGLGLDGARPRKAYMAIHYGSHGVVYNVWNGTSMLFPIDALPTLEPSPALHGNGETRFAPQWAPAPGPGAFVCWSRSDGRVYLRYVSPAGQLGSVAPVSEGSNCSMTLGPDGALHMVYASGGLRYRRIEVLPD